MALDVDSPSVHTHLNILQGIINRLAGNSANAKTWTITFVVAILVLMSNGGTARASIVAFLPIAVFVFLDAYYLAMERDFRGLYLAFVRQLHAGELVTNRIFVIDPPRGFKHRANTIIQALGSASIWSFYLTLIVAVIIVAYLSRLASNQSSGG